MQHNECVCVVGLTLVFTIKGVSGEGGGGESLLDIASCERTTAMMNPERYISPTVIILFIVFF